MGVEGIYFEDDRETVYAGSVIMGPPSYKSHPNSVIYVNNQGFYSDPVVVGNGDPSCEYIDDSESSIRLLDDSECCIRLLDNSESCLLY